MDKNTIMNVFGKNPVFFLALLQRLFRPLAVSDIHAAALERNTPTRTVLDDLIDNKKSPFTGLQLKGILGTPFLHRNRSFRGSLQGIAVQYHPEENQTWFFL